MEMTVGEVAQRAGVKVSTLHVYEQKGLIHSWRNAGNQRRYHRNVLRRIAVIKAAQMVGLTLEEVAESLADLPKHQASSQQEWEQMASNWNAMLEASYCAAQSTAERSRRLHWLRLLVDGVLRHLQPARYSSADL